MISDGAENLYGLGPISVSPTLQQKGIKSPLMHQAIDELKAIAAKGCLLLDDPDYCHRFGFQAREGLTLAELPPEV